MNQIIAEKKYIAQQMPDVPYDSLSQSYVRSEVKLTNLSQYSFGLQANNRRDVNVTERLIELNDKFVVTHFFLGLKHIAAATPTDEQHLNAKIHTFANPNIFTGNNANVAALYNGSFSWTINRKQFLPEFPLRSFLRVPTSQATGANDLTDGFDNGLYGFYPCEPTLIDGRQTLDIVANIGSAVNMVVANNYVAAVLELRGYLIVNAQQ